MDRRTLESMLAAWRLLMSHGQSNMAADLSSLVHRSVPMLTWADWLHCTEHPGSMFRYGIAREKE
jgi:hypothetical protein